MFFNNQGSMNRKVMQGNLFGNIWDLMGKFCLQYVLGHLHRKPNLQAALL